jgi:hypothetical protein
LRFYFTARPAESDILERKSTGLFDEQVRNKADIGNQYL